jgi:hypothetical protein
MEGPTFRFPTGSIAWFLLESNRRFSAVYFNGPVEYRTYTRASTDSVNMPVRSRFVDAPHYYGTLFHELVHSTGHVSRLNRRFGAHFGDELYSKEELVAGQGLTLSLVQENQARQRCATLTISPGQEIGQTTFFLKKRGHLGSCTAPALVRSLGSQVVHPV